MIDDLEMPPFLRKIFILTVITIFLIGLKFSAPLIAPILLSMFLTIIIVPLIMWLKNKGIPYKIAHLITIIGSLIIGLLSIGLLYNTLIELKGVIPKISISSSSFLAGQANIILQSLTSAVNLMNMANFVETGFFVLLATIFLISDAPNFEKRLLKGFKKNSPRLEHMINLVNEFTIYFQIRAKVNLFTAIGISIIVIPFGIDFALLWGILTFLLGFIPYIGIIIATIPPMLLAWSKYGIQGALAIIILFSIINTIAESFIFPRQASKGLELSMYVVFVSLFFWGWIFGPIGVFIAVPLTIILVKYLENYDESKWLASLMKSSDEDAKN